jgi:hypothetical protein
VVEPPKDFDPPDARKRKEREAWWWQMHDWLAQELDRQHVANMQRANTKANAARLRAKFRTLTPEESAIEAARRGGDPEPLRKLYPQFADCIHALPQSRGRRKDPNTAFKPDKIAARFVPRIRALWQQQYKQKNRPESDGKISAEAFAAAIYKDWSGYPLTRDDVQRAAKPSGKHKQPRRKSRVK